MRAVLAAWIVAFVALASAHAVMAQEPSPKERGKLQEKIEWMTMWKLIEALELDKPTADKVYAIRRKYLEQKQKLVKVIDEGVRSLKQQLEQESEKVDEAGLAEQIAKIREARQKLEGLVDDQFQELSKVLSVRQQAKLMVFMKEFPQELRSMFRGPGFHPPPLPPRPGGRFGPPPPGRGPDFDPAANADRLSPE